MPRTRPWALYVLALAALAWLWISRDCAPDREAVEVSTEEAAPPSLPGSRPAPRSVEIADVRTASLAGTVTSEGAAPLAGATVCATAKPLLLPTSLARDPFCASTDAQGRFRIERLPAAHYAVTAHAPRHVPARHRTAEGDDHVALASGQQREGIDLVLAPGGVLLRGTVEDGTGGPIEGAWVTATPGTWPRMGGLAQAGWPVRGDGEGAFSLWVAPGETEVWAAADGYAPGWRATSAPTEGLVLRLYPEAVIEGVVVRAEGDEPVADAFVRVVAGTKSASATTDPSGRFRIDRLAPGRYSVSATTDDAAGRAPGSVVVHMGQSAEVRVRLHAATLVLGRIVDEASDEPCRSGGVVLVGDAGEPGGGGTVEDEGRVRIRGVAPGRYRVMVTCVGKLAPEEAPELVVGAKPLGEQTWRVRAGTSLAGMVVDDEGASVHGAIVTASPTGEDAREQMAGGSATSGDDGAFRIEGLRAGLHRVQPTRGSLSGEGVELRVPASGLTDARLVIPRPATIRGHVRSASGSAIADAQVMAIAMGPAPGGRAFTDADGAYAVESLAAGRYRLHAEGMDDDDGPTVDASAGETIDVDLVAPARDRSIDGHVVDGEGSPIPDVAVSAIRENYRAWAYRSIPWVATDAEGHFSLSGLGDGEYRLEATRGETTEGELRHVAAGSTVEIVLKPLGKLSGTARFADGGAPPSFTLSLRGPEFLHERFEHTDGRWSIDAVPGGDWEIAAAAAEGSGSARTSIEAGEAKGDIAIEILERGSVSGIVADGETGAPLVGVSVHASDESGTFTHRATDRLDARRVTDVQGRFEIEADPGAIALQVRVAPPLEGFIEIQRPVTVPAGGHVDVGTIALPHMRLKPGDARGWFGFSWSAPTGSLDGEEGVRVTEVVRRSPMAAAGLAVGDEIVAIDGVDVRGGAWPNVHSLIAVPPGTTIEFRLADERALEVTAIAKP